MMMYTYIVCILEVSIRPRPDITRPKPLEPNPGSLKFSGLGHVSENPSMPGQRNSKNLRIPEQQNWADYSHFGRG